MLRAPIMYKWCPMVHGHVVRLSWRTNYNNGIIFPPSTILYFFTNLHNDYVQVKIKYLIVDLNSQINFIDILERYLLYTRNYIEVK